MTLVTGSGYRIADEPRPGAMEHLAVEPLWPFLAIMFGGAWLSWPWFVFNGFAVGSPTRQRELGIALGGFAVTAVMLVGLFYAVGVGWLPQESLPYALLALTVAKLAVTYWLHVLQSQTFEIYTFYGGVVRPGFVVLIAAYILNQFMAPKLLQAAPLVLFWLR